MIDSSLEMSDFFPRNFVGDINAIATLAGDAAFRGLLKALDCLGTSGKGVLVALGVLLHIFLLILIGVTRAFRGLTNPSSSNRLRCTEDFLTDFLAADGGVRFFGVFGVFGSCNAIQQG